MQYEDWEGSLPAAVTADRIWRMQAYRLALFATHVAALDVRELQRNRSMFGVADQLLRAVGSVGANISEGYSRGTGMDRARFYEYALGSAREGRHWYLSVHELLGADRVAERVDLLTRVMRLLLAALPVARRESLRRS